LHLELTVSIGVGQALRYAGTEIQCVGL